MFQLCSASYICVCLLLQKIHKLRSDRLKIPKTTFDDEEATTTLSSTKSFSRTASYYTYWYRYYDKIATLAYCFNFDIDENSSISLE